MRGRTTILFGLLTSCSVPGIGWDDETPPVDSGVVVAEYESFTGVVYGADGEPVSSAYLTVMPRGHGAETEADGTFQFSRLSPGIYQLVVAAAGYETREVTAPLGVWEEFLEIELQPKLPVDGLAEIRVRDASGAALVGGVVTASTGQTTTTDEDGVAFLYDLGGQVIDVAVEHPNDRSWARSVEQVEVPELGGVQVAVQLAGRPLEGSIEFGSTACDACHPTIAAGVAASPHGRTLMQDIEPSLLAQFEADTFVDLGVGASALLTLVATVPTVELTDAGAATRQFAVDGVIGDQDQGSVVYTLINEQAYPLPVAWIAARPELGSWPEAVERVVSWEVSRWFDGLGDFTFNLASNPSPSSSADALCFPCHATGFTLSARGDGGVDLTPTTGPGPRWTEPGVGCERCHGAASSHLEATFETKALAITNPAKLDKARAADVCGQCHGATSGDGTGAPYPWSDALGLFHVGEDLSAYGASNANSWPNGAAAAAAQQSDELAVSPHATNDAYGLLCFDCHDPHGQAALPDLLRLDARDNTLCSSCHLQRTWDNDTQALEDHDLHTLYDPASQEQGGRCVGCHMPKTAAQIAFSDASGAGDAASHFFAAQPPQQTLDWFDAQGALFLPVGSFPMHSCGECHELNAWYSGFVFDGAYGDPTDRNTHQDHQTDYVGMFP